MRSSRSRMPARLRPNGERTSVYINSSETAKKPNTRKKNVISLARSMPNFGRSRRLMPLSPPVSEFQR